MKITKQVTVDICDFCKKNECYEHSKCALCNKAFCYDCTKTFIKKYTSGVYRSSGGDLTLCHPCDRALHEKPTEKFLAFLAIEQLKFELDSWNSNFRLRQKAAEEKIDTFPTNAV